MSITCALSDSQIEKLFKLTYKRMKDALDSNTEFDADLYMRDLFNKISNREDEDTAAKFIQQVPSIIRTIAAKTVFDNLDLTSNLTEDGVKKLSREFKSEDGIKIVSERYAPVAPEKGAEPTEAEKKTETLQLKQIVGGEEPVTIDKPNRFKTLSPFGGTLQNYIKFNPSEQGDDKVIIEENNPELIHIINTFQRIKQIQAMSDITDGIEYDGKKLMYKAENLDRFAVGDNFNILDKSTRDEITLSRKIRKNKDKVDPSIAQVDQRVILLLTDNNTKEVLYFDNEGNITDKEKGKPVYQFMRVVRKEGKNFTVKDIYNKEDQVISPEEFADATYDPKIDGTKEEYTELVKKEQQKEMKELYDLQQKALKNEAPLLPVTGITTGVPSNLSRTIIKLDQLTKFPGIDNSVYDTITILPKKRNSIAEGRAVITINGDPFELDRPRMTQELSTEIANVMTSTAIPNQNKINYLEQFLSPSIAASSRKYKFQYDKDGKYIYFKEFAKFNEKEPIGKDNLLSADTLKKLTPEQLQEVKDRIQRVLLNGGPKNTVEGETNTVYMSYSKKALEGKKKYQRLAPDGKSFKDLDYVDFIKSFPTNVYITNADPGFYNYVVSYTTPDSLLGQVINKSDEAANNKITKTKEDLINRLKEGIEASGTINQEPTKDTLWDIFEENGNRISFYNYYKDPAVTKLTEADKGKVATFKYVSQIITDNNQVFNDVVQVFVDGKYVGNVATTDFAGIDVTDAAAVQREFAGAVKTKSRLDEAGNLKEILEQRREVEHYDRIAYQRGFTSTPQSKKAETTQILTTPGAESPTSPNTANNVIFEDDGDIDLDSIPGGLPRKGFSKELINPAKILKAKLWWNSDKIKPLRELIDLQHISNIVNSDVFATFIVNAGILADVSEKPGTIKVNKLNGSFYQNLTVYHEAWHAFSQLFLTKEQKTKLYEELQNYTDKNGNKPYASMSFRQLEEMLAEDFRNYVKTGKAKTNAPVRNSLFRKILNFLKQLFGKALNKFRKKDILIDSLNSPMAKELFDNLYQGKFNSYQASVDNALLYELDRGVRQISNPKENALSPQDSNQVSRSIDSAWSEIIDGIYKTRVKRARQEAIEKLTEEGKEVTKEAVEQIVQSKGLKSASIVMLSDPAKRAWMYNQTKLKFEAALKAESDKLNKIEGQDKFNTYTTLEEIKKNAVAIMKNKKGEDKHFFLTSQVVDFSKLDPSLKRGERVKGLDYKDSIKILGDFYKHNEITDENGRPVDIVIIPRLEDAQLQFENYKKAEKQKAYTDLIENPDAKAVTLDEEQELIRDNIRILQTTLANWGDERSGVVKYHRENTDYEVSKDRYEVELANETKQSLDADGNVIDEAENTGSLENTMEAKTGTQSLQQMMSKETTYIIKSLFKVNPDGSIPTDRFGFKERVDFNTVFTILAKTIGGERDRYAAYTKLAEEAQKFPELKQLYETKYPNPSAIENKFEFDVSKQFWLDFAKYRVRYMQLFAYNDKESGTVDFKVKESSIAIDNTLNRWSSLFKSTLPTEFISKSKENISSLNLSNVVNKFSTKGELKPENGLDFARAIAIDMDKNENIQQELIANFDYYGLDYIFDIVKGFNEIENIQKTIPQDPRLTPERLKYLALFKANPVEVLRDVIPAGVLSNLTGAVKELTQLKRLAELQSKYGFDSATTGVIRANGNTGYQEMNWSAATAYAYALNAVTDMNQLWTDPRFSYMSRLNPAINSYTLNLTIIKSLFDTTTGKKIPGKSVQLMAVDGTSISKKTSVMKNGRSIEIEEAAGNTTTELDPYSKFLQELHTMSLGGVAEFPRHSEKKFSYGLKVIGGIEGDTVGYTTKGKDKNLYVDLDKFFKDPDKKGISEGEFYAAGNNLFPYLQSEFDRIKKFRGPNKDQYLRFTGYNTLVNDGNDVDVPQGSVFVAFDGVLRQDTKNALYELADQQIDIPLVDYLRNSPLKKQIFRDMVDYFDEKTASLNKLYFEKVPYLSKSIFEKIGYTADQLTYDKLNQLTNDKNITNTILKAYSYNDWIHKFETSNLLYGDHAQWGHDKEDWSKRIPGLTSDGIGFLFDAGTIAFINDYFNKNNYAKTISTNETNYDTFRYSEKLNTAIIKDAVRESIYLDDYLDAWREEYSSVYKDKDLIEKLLANDAKAYKGMKEGDGMAYMTFDAYRTLHETGRGWSMAQEDLYQKIIRGERVDPKTVKEGFPVYKLHYFGAIENDIIQATGMHKFSVIPLIPGVNAKEGSQLDVLHKKMMKENVQYVTFGTGSKGANLTADGKLDNIFANKQDKSINDDVPFTINPIYMANLKEVTVINEYLKGSIPIATQTRGIILDNLYSDGKLLNETHAPVVNEYLSAVKDYSEILKDELLNDIGFELIDGRYVGNLTQFIEVLRDELKNRDTPEHLIRLLNTTEDEQLAMDLSLHPEADNVEKIIMSFLQNGLIKQKTNGEPLVQTPTTFTNGLWDAEFESITDLEEIKKFRGTNTLAFYLTNKDQNGKRTRSTEMKVVIALQGPFLNLLNAKHTDGEKIATLDRLNEMIKDSKWLESNKDAVTIFGPRIPNDATNTIEAATVWHFLPESFLNSIIVPTEIVGKAGSDFDGDKLFMTFPNIDKEGKYISKGVDNFKETLKKAQDNAKSKKPVKGIPSPASIISQQKKYLQNKFLKSAVDILMLPENFAYLVKPNGTYLVDKYVPELEENKSGYDRYENTHGQATKTSAADENGKRKKVTSPTTGFEQLYNLYKHDACLTLEASLGIMAKTSKSHPINKSIGAPMPAKYRASSYNSALNRTIETGFLLPIIMRFDHNVTTNSKGEEVISLGGIRTKKGSRITDVISHDLQGILDRAKESFPFELKLVPKAMPVYNYLLQAGVDEEESFFFLNQPLISEFLERQQLMESAYSKMNIFSKEKFIADSMIKNLLKNYKEADLKQMYNAINVAKLRYTLNELKEASLDKKYYFNLRALDDANSLSSKTIYEITLGELIEKLNNKGIAPQNIAAISTNPKMSRDENVYWYSDNINTTENFAFATEYLSNNYLPDGKIYLKTLKDNYTKKNNSDLTALALFMNYLELERQYKGMNDLQQLFSPDTSKLDTIQQIIKRQEAYNEMLAKPKIGEKFARRESVDKDYVNRLINESVLSSFNQDKLILDLTRPLFNLRLHPTVTNFISEVFVDQNKSAQVRNNPTFGKGVKGQERFSTLFNNGVVNYIFQNYTSDFVNGKGELVNIPESYKSLDIIIEDDMPSDAAVYEEGIAINTRVIENDFATKAYLNTNQSEDSYKNRGLDTFTLKQDPFQTLASYYRYVIAREYIRVNNPIEELEKNKYFMKRVAELGNADAAFESFISERTLAASFNNRYIMGKTKYSYSDSIMNLIDEFGDTLKITYPITAQLAPGENADGAKVLQLNNKKEAQGELASIYYNNLRSLADPSIMKVENVSDNNRISEMFNLLSLMMFYQHGIGNTKLGFTKVLDPIQYKSIMQAASTDFINNYLNKDTLNTIFNTIVSMDRFKNHLTSPEGYRHADIADLSAGNITENGTDEVEMSFDEDEGENLVPVRLINQEDVDLFNQAVNRAKGAKPQKWFTSKTLFPAFYNSATGKREGMPQATIWIKNKYGNYDMLDQESGEVYYENVNLSTGMYKAPKVETKTEPVTPTEATVATTQPTVSSINLIPENNYTITSYTNEPKKGTYHNIIRTGKKPLDYKVIDVSDKGVLVRNEETQKEKLFTKDEYFKTFNISEDAGFSVLGEYGLAEVYRYTELQNGQPVYSLEINLYDESNEGKGLGKDIYKAAIQEIIKRNGVLTPGNVVEGNKVWESFERDGLLRNEITREGESIIVIGTQPTETKVEQPELNDSIENDMKVYQDLLKENNGKQPQSFMSDNRMYKLNKFGNYDLVDKTTGEIYVRNLNMETGKQETEPGLDAPVSQEVIQRELNRIITLRAEINLEEQLAGLGYDINDIINNLANVKTQEDLNKITKILDKLC